MGRAGSKCGPVAARLTNHYFLLRHGHSLANLQRLISSEPALAVKEHGLSHKGVQQAAHAADAFAALLAGRPRCRVALFSSDFLRARETAGIVLDRLMTEPRLKVLGERVHTNTSLRERSFGDLDGQHDSNYNRVWEADQIDAAHTQYGVESIESVLARGAAAVCDAEAQLSAEEASADREADAAPWHVVLVAHGDVLQILQTWFMGVDPRTHRSLPHLETASFRQVHQAA